MLPKARYPVRPARLSNSECYRRVPAEGNRSWAHLEETFESFLLLSKRHRKTRSCSERCRKIQELSSKPMCWITKESTKRCLPSRVSFSTWGFWVAFLLLHSRKRIVATGIAMLMSPKMMRTTVTSVAKSNNGNENDIYGFSSFTR